MRDEGMSLGSVSRTEDVHPSEGPPPVPSWTNGPEVVSQDGVPPTSTSDHGTSSSAPQMRTMKMMFKKFPQLQAGAPEGPPSASSTSSAVHSEQETQLSSKLHSLTSTKKEEPLPTLEKRERDDGDLPPAMAHPKKLLASNRNCQLTSPLPDDAGTVNEKRERDENDTPPAMPHPKRLLVAGRTNATTTTMQDPHGLSDTSRRPNVETETASSSSTSATTPSTMAHSTDDAAALQRTIVGLQLELQYTKENLMHEEARWAHFRARAKMAKIWGVLMGLEEPGEAAEATPVAPAKSSGKAGKEITSELETQLEDIQYSLAEESSRAQALTKEAERLSAENQALQRQLIQLEAREPLEYQQVINHALYKELLACYHNEHATCQKFMQQLEALKEELDRSTRHLAEIEQRILAQEKRKRKKLEDTVHERDRRIMKLEEKEKEQEASSRFGKVEELQRQLEQEKAKKEEYYEMFKQLSKKLQKALSRQRAQNADDDIASEYQNVTRAYEEELQKNQDLVQRIEDKDNTTNKLMTEKLKHQHTIKHLEGDLERKRVALESCEKIVANQESWIEKMREVFDALQTEERKLSLHHRDLWTANCSQEKELNTLRIECERLRQQVHNSREAVQSLTTKSEQLLKQATDEAKDSRSKTEELKSLERKYSRIKDKLAKCHEEPSTPTTGSKDEQVRELQKKVAQFRTILNCNVCKIRVKNTIIQRCLHVFCAQCLDANLQSRKRKCPVCAMKFAESDVRTLPGLFDA
uniref:E3 ubiquitin protein ligase n=1 Tax=Eutreptiella gymnastica TaxID=73025 RepID=A0A7S1IQH4_9EUGL|mmetsp:Transcript_34891/g.62366  ORF Transcript_34891/g.62366 Transcript_34891/m.62366 type:complete len:756 (+) Transcript_34891:45-2312(+)